MITASFTPETITPDDSFPRIYKKTDTGSIYEQPANGEPLYIRIKQSETDPAKYSAPSSAHEHVMGSLNIVIEKGSTVA